MKNHIKNYIKIMELTAVPFGTAQVDGVPFEYEIRVKKVEGNNIQSFGLM